MGSVEPTEEGLKRRSLIKRAGIVGVGVVAWSTPSVTSLASSAHAAGSPQGGCTTCSGDPNNTCFDQVLCGSTGPFQQCGCANESDLDGCGCYENDLCANRTPCPSGTCPGNQICLLTCCGEALCWDPCGTNPASPRQAPKSGAKGFNG